MRARRVLTLIVWSVGSMVLLGCSDDDDAGAPNVDRVGEQVEHGDPDVARIRVTSQRSDGRVVVVDEVELADGPGWVAIYRDGEGAPGQQLGVSEQLEPGTSRDVVVRLEAPLDGDDRVHAMVHTESNGNRTFDHPDADPPATADDGIVVAAFDIKISS